MIAATAPALVRLGRVAPLAVLMVLSACQGESERSSSAQRAAPASPPTDRPDDTTAQMAVGATDQARDPARERMVLKDISVEVAERPDRAPAELYTRALGRELGRFLVASPYFFARASDVQNDYRARPGGLTIAIDYDVVEVPKGGAELAALLQVSINCSVRWRDAGSDVAPHALVVAERSLTAKERAETDRLIEFTVREAVMHAGHTLIAQEQIRVGGPSALHSGLESDDNELLAWSLAIVAERPAPDLYDPVVSALASTDAEVRDGAVAALVALGEPRAVDALAKRAAFDDLDFMGKVLDAIIALGGDDARDYLEFIASGHPDHKLRMRAQAGLGRLSK